jgi:RNA polymerase sigma factor (sigma-70 family)
MTECVPPSTTKTIDDRSGPQWFGATEWTWIVKAGNLDSPQRGQALERICKAYWTPIYNFIRRYYREPQDAKDLAQAFIARLLEQNFWARADPAKGRFRTFLLKALRNFLADHHDRMTADKRGGRFSFVSLNELDGEGLPAPAAGGTFSEAHQYDRQWAFALLGNAQDKLRQEIFASGKAALYERVSVTGGTTVNPMSYAAIALELGTTVPAIKSTVRRWRTRYQQLVREEVARTVLNPADIPDELRHLLRVIAT